ncbi:MAG: hypothetical protein JO179_06310, partial [Solirubrobacterales bacterium]|nr:hypothetical protein [Solirubrobacterales bacterium]
AVATADPLNSDGFAPLYLSGGEGAVEVGADPVLVQVQTSNSGAAGTGLSESELTAQAQSPTGAIALLAQDASVAPTTIKRVGELIAAGTVRLPAAPSQQVRIRRGATGCRSASAAVRTTSRLGRMRLEPWVRALLHARTCARLVPGGVLQLLALARTGSGRARGQVTLLAQARVDSGRVGAACRWIMRHARARHGSALLLVRLVGFAHPRRM